jgi:hypothetical protein
LVVCSGALQRGFWEGWVLEDVATDLFRRSKSYGGWLTGGSAGVVKFVAVRFLESQVLEDVAAALCVVENRIEAGDYAVVVGCRDTLR